MTECKHWNNHILRETQDERWNEQPEEESLNTFEEHQHHHHHQKTQEKFTRFGLDSNTRAKECVSQTSLRRASRCLYQCALHEEAVVLCYTAGKQGHHSHTPAVGATLFWLTCPYLNRFVSQLERDGGITVVRTLLSTHPEVLHSHCNSHIIFLERVKQLLHEEQWEFYRTHFVDSVQNNSDACTNSAFSSTELTNKTRTSHTGKRYGNAAVCHEGDIKCLHALVAQSLAGASNPIGDAVVNYLYFLHQYLELHNLLSEKNKEEDENSCSTRNKEDEQSQRKRLGSIKLFEEFILYNLVADSKEHEASEKEQHECKKANVNEQEMEDANTEDMATSACKKYTMVPMHEMVQIQPDLCTQAKVVLTFLQQSAKMSCRKHTTSLLL